MCNIAIPRGQYLRVFSYRNFLSLKTLKTFISKNKSNNKGSFCLFLIQGPALQPRMALHTRSCYPSLLWRKHRSVTGPGRGALVSHNTHQLFCNVTSHSGWLSSFQCGYLGAGAGPLLSFVWLFQCLVLSKFSSVGH